MSEKRQVQLVELTVFQWLFCMIAFGMLYGALRRIADWLQVIAQALAK